jgi:hypothetical protein
MPLYEGVLGNRNIAPRILNLGTRWSWVGGLVGPKAGLDAVAKRKVPCPWQESNSGSPDRSLINIPTELSWIRYIDEDKNKPNPPDNFQCGSQYEISSKSGLFQT